MITSRSVRGAALIAALLAVPGLQAAEVAGVKIDDQIKVEGSNLVLNGAGVRTKFFFKVYVGALYVPQRVSAAPAILESSAPRRMSLRMMRNLDADKLLEALQEGLHNNLDDAEMATLKPQSEQLEAIMKKIGTAHEGDTFAIDFTATGIAVSMNGEPRGTVAGPAFAKALLKVWLGDKPADASLKKALLGS